MEHETTNLTVITEEQLLDVLPEAMRRETLRIRSPRYLRQLLDAVLADAVQGPGKWGKYSFEKYEGQVRKHYSLVQKYQTLLRINWQSIEYKTWFRMTRRAILEGQDLPSSERGPKNKESKRAQQIHRVQRGMHALPTQMRQSARAVHHRYQADKLLRAIYTRINAGAAYEEGTLQYFSVQQILEISWQDPEYRAWIRGTLREILSRRRKTEPSVELSVASEPQQDKAS